MTEEQNRIREAHRLAQKALRLANEARDAARRLKAFKERHRASSSRGNLVYVEDTSTLREGDDNVRSL